MRKGNKKLCKKYKLKLDNQENIPKSNGVLKTICFDFGL